MTQRFRANSGESQHGASPRFSLAFSLGVINFIRVATFVERQRLPTARFIVAVARLVPLFRISDPSGVHQQRSVPFFEVICHENGILRRWFEK